MLTTPRTDARELDARLTGTAVGPGDEGWDAARLAWDLAVDQRPALVATVRSAEDVVAVVRHAREHGLRVAPQGTGHNASALGSLAGTILLKTHELRGVELDVARRTVRVEAGALWLDVTSQCAPHGLVPPLGSSPDVGVVGFTLGGGYCWAARKHGLAADAVRAAEVVLADGTQVRATAGEHPDLFWALRGGGGNFGIVTALELEVFAEPEVHGASIFFPIERGAEVLRAWRRLVDTLEDASTSYARFLQLPDLPDIPEPVRGGRFVNVEFVHFGPEAEAHAIIAPIRALGPQLELGGPLDAVGLNHFHLDPEAPVPFLGGAHMILADLPDAGIDAFVAAAGADARTPLLLAEIRQLGGALARRADGGGALGRFDGRFATFAGGIPVDAVVAAGIEGAIERIDEALAPWDGGTRYLNFVEAPADTATMFAADAHARLRAIRAEVDPDGLIQANHEIR